MPGGEPEMGKVLVVLHVSQHSGPQRSLAPRLDRLRERGVELMTIVPSAGAAAEAASAYGPVLEGGPGALLVPRGLAAAAALPLRLRRDARFVRAAVARFVPDVVIVSSALLPSAVSGARSDGAPTLVYSGELLPDHGLRGLAARRILHFVGRRASAVVACSEAVAQTWRGTGVEARVVNPPIGEPESSTLAERARQLRLRLGLDRGFAVVSSLGAITPGRGQDTLVEALASSRRRGGGWTLGIGGEPYDRRGDLAFAERLRRRAAELGVSESVVFTGRIDDPEALYAASNVFVNPARFSEPFGRAACEALVCGCPVVSTDTGGIPEALRDEETALLVAPGYPEPLAAAIERLIGDPGLAGRLVRQGAADVAHRFSPAVSQAAFDAALSAALGDRAAHRR